MNPWLDNKATSIFLFHNTVIGLLNHPSGKTHSKWMAVLVTLLHIILHPVKISLNNYTNK